MHGPEWLLVIGTVALLVGPLAALHAASKIRDYWKKRARDSAHSKQDQS